MEKKACTKCKILKSTNYFYLDKTKGDFRSHCKDCVREKRKEYRDKNKERIAKYMKTYIPKYRKRKRDGNF